jgi:hypothetical protein
MDCSSVNGNPLPPDSCAHRLPVLLECSGLSNSVVGQLYRVESGRDGDQVSAVGRRTPGRDQRTFGGLPDLGCLPSQMTV